MQGGFATTAKKKFNELMTKQQNSSQSDQPVIDVLQWVIQESAPHWSCITLLWSLTLIIPPLSSVQCLWIFFSFSFFVLPYVKQESCNLISSAGEGTCGVPQGSILGPRVHSVKHIAQTYLNSYVLSRDGMEAVSNYKPFYDAIEKMMPVD